MASDREQYSAALQEWDAHVREGHFSVAPEQGVTAVLCPYVDPLPPHAPYDETNDYPALRKETLDVAEDLQARGRTLLVALNAQPFDFHETLTNPNVSDVIVIGHGCLASVAVEHPEGNNRLDWKDLADMADHLKSGRFVQRFCGLTPRRLNVPVGLMVVSRPSHVIAALGERFNPIGLDDPVNDTLVPITQLSRMSYEDIKRDFPQEKLPMVSRAHVALGAIKATVRSGF